MAPTYVRLLQAVRPRLLLGLTATPERADGTDITARFGGRAAVELRLWEALDRGLVSPFQYFGVNDEVALDGVRWQRGQGYDVADLSNLYTGSDRPVQLVLRAVAERVMSPLSMRALGFCVDIHHAEFMADRFAAAGIPSRALTPTLFQCESQSTASSHSPTGQRHIHHERRGWTVHLFVRETKVADGALGAPAYVYAGTMRYVQHTGDRPMRILWQLEHAFLDETFHPAKVAAG